MKPARRRGSLKVIRNEAQPPPQGQGGLAKDINDQVLDGVREAYKSYGLILGQVEERIFRAAISATTAILGGKLSETLKIAHNVLMEMALCESLSTNPLMVRRIRSLMAFLLEGKIDDLMEQHLNRMNTLAKQIAEKDGSGGIGAALNGDGKPPENSPTPPL